MILCDAQGKPFELGESVGRGGEAIVYRVSGQPTRLAKIYDPAPRPNYNRKLAWMVEHPPENPTQASNHPSLAWPDSLLFDEKKDLKGYAMPFIRRAVPLLDVFNPRRRAVILPLFDSRYLHRVARNLCASLVALHEKGYVAGDLNESNVLVTTSALVTLIDADSFQVTERTTEQEVVHPCPVGKFEYTPPELQGKRLSEVIRLPEHDAFGLAVLIFQLLIEGNHPFRAQWLPKGDPPPLEARIATGAFPYTSAPSLLVLPPKNAPDINWLYPGLVELVRRCFVDGHTDPRLRPSPSQWERAIAEAELNLIPCSNGHYYSGHLPHCPYCLRMGKTIAPARPGISMPRKSPWVNPGSSTRPPQPQPGSQRAPQPATHASQARLNLQPGQKPPVSAPPGSNPTASGFPSSSSTAARGVSNTGAYLINRVGNPTQPVSQPGKPTRPGGGQPAAWLKTQTQSGLANGTVAIQSIPHNWVSSQASRQTAPVPKPFASGIILPRPAARSTSVRTWLWQRTYRSFLYGGSNGAISGALPGILLALITYSGGYPLAWPTLIALGGAGGGLARGWQPGYRLGGWIDRNIGWQNFLQGLGLISGLLAGGAVGIMFGLAILPIFIGPILGALIGKELGKKLWQLGTLAGWSRIWSLAAALSTAGLGWVIAGLAGTGGLSLLGPQFEQALAGSGIRPFLTFLLSGAFCGALGGLVAGTFADFVAGLLGLAD